ncbi:hypothetical protein [Streptomyces chartreusis]|uniref:hypothetical protein n=1 Tax=Streptomyces chartreusis TaxID=1969 RepID=UPI0033C9D14D
MKKKPPSTASQPVSTFRRSGARRPPAGAMSLPAMPEMWWNSNKSSSNIAVGWQVTLFDSSTSTEKHAVVSPRCDGLVLHASNPQQLGMGIRPFKTSVPVRDDEAHVKCGADNCCGTKPKIGKRPKPSAPPPLVEALQVRGHAQLGWQEEIDSFNRSTLLFRRSERWSEAISTALLGPWADPLLSDGFLPARAFSALKSEAQTIHRQLVPLWQRGTRHGRVLSLDASLGLGLSLYDLVRADVDLLDRTDIGVFDDERLNQLLRRLKPTEREIVLTYAETHGLTWTEAATDIVGPADAEAFGERVRRKVKREADEQHRRAAQRRLPPNGS